MSIARLKISLVQSNPTVGGIEFNTSCVLVKTKEAEIEGSDLIIFPEMYLSGYQPLDLVNRRSFLENISFQVQNIAEKTMGLNIRVLIGAPWLLDGKIYNAFISIHRGDIKIVSKKCHLPNYDVFDEKRFFTPGNAPKPIVVPVKGQKRKIGLQICEDLWDEQYSCKVSDLQKELGAELIVNISASPYSKNKIKERKHLVSSKAGKLGIPFIYCNII